MEIRHPIVAGTFYEASPKSCVQMIERCLAGYQPPNDLGKVVGGVVPHAGWVYSGPTAAKVFLTLKGAAPKTFLLFGAVHGYTREVAMFPSGAWVTPLGDVAVDAELAEVILEETRGLVKAAPRAHAGEHSIEVQVPFIKHMFPEAKILPIAVPPDRGAAQVGEAVGRVLAKREGVVAVGTSDLTHYGMNYHTMSHGPLPKALSWMKQNDQRIITLMENLSAEEIVSEAEANQNACGAGALAAVVAAVREMGAKHGRLLEYTTSAEVMGDLYASSAVGYAAVVFCA